MTEATQLPSRSENLDPNAVDFSPPKRLRVEVASGAPAATFSMRRPTQGLLDDVENHAQRVASWQPMPQIRQLAPRRFQRPMQAGARAPQQPLPPVESSGVRGGFGRMAAGPFRQAPPPFSQATAPARASPAVPPTTGPVGSPSLTPVPAFWEPTSRPAATTTAAAPPAAAPSAASARPFAPRAKPPEPPHAAEVLSFAEQVEQQLKIQTHEETLARIKAKEQEKRDRQERELRQRIEASARLKRQVEAAFAQRDALEGAVQRASDACDAAEVATARATALREASAAELEELEGLVELGKRASRGALIRALEDAEARFDELDAAVAVQEECVEAVAPSMAALGSLVEAAQLWPAGSETARRAEEECAAEYDVLAPLAEAVEALRARAALAAAALDEHADGGVPSQSELHARLKAAQKAAPPAAPGPRWTRHVHNRALTAAEVELVDDYLSGDGNPSELLAELNNIPVTREKVLCLRPGEWLNDEVINFFMELLKGRTAARSGAAAAAASASGEASGEAALPRVHFFNTLFYAKLTKDERGYDYSGVKRWTRKNKLFEQDMLVCPVHVHGNHWVLAVVNFRDKRFEYYDSLKGSEGQCLKNLRKYLKDESLDKLKATWDDTGWTDHNFRDGTPQQRNGWDCGVFMCKTADYLSQEGKLEFTQQDMDYFRRRLVVEIRNSQLLEDQDAQ